jgi:hypothetical protein
MRQSRLQTRGFRGCSFVTLKVKETRFCRSGKMGVKFGGKTDEVKPAVAGGGDGRDKARVVWS